ncbi:MAG TPA: ABC transporter permease [Ilumatobacteraceae bacterium]
MAETIAATAAADGDVGGPAADGHGVGVEVGRLARLRANSWTKFAIRRLINFVVVMLGLVVFVFLMLRLIPGDPAEIMASVNGTPDRIGEIRSELGLNKPFVTQFGHYLKGVATGNLGNSFNTRQPVHQILTERLPLSAKVAGLSLLFVLVVSIPGGILMGALTREQRHRRIQTAFTTVTSIVGTLPAYFTATILAFFLAVHYKLLPVAGGHTWKGLILPALAVSIPPTATLTRVVRVETLNVLAQDYIRTARSKRLRPLRIYLRHVLPNASTAALTIGGIIFAQLIGGAVIVENVFALNGLGRTLVSAVINRDYPVVQGVILALGATIIVVNTVIDFLLAIIDPRTTTRQA